MFSALMLHVEGKATDMPRLQPSGSSANQLADKGKEDEKIWTRILSEVSAKCGSNMQATVIVLGDHKCGNHSLLSKLEKEKEGAKTRASALEYHTLHVQADFRDGSYAYQLGTAGGALGPAESMTLPVWLLDGDDSFSPLLSHALPASSPSKSVVVLSAAIDNPGLIHSLRKWANILASQVTSKYDKSTLAEARQIQERFWQEYVEPVESSMTASIMQGMEDPIVVPLDQGVLCENNGVSTVVVITKSDLAPEMPTVQWEKQVVQVRRFCLAHGCALFYVSSKKGHNLQHLYKYIVHRAYGLGFTSVAQLIDRESLFVPAGWDSDKKIEILAQGVNDADTLEPTREKPPVKETLIEAEEEQSFLSRLQSMDAAPLVKKQSAMMDGEANAEQTNATLASFFSNLLKPSPGKGAAPQSAVSATPLDPAAQLDRIRSSSTKTTPLQSEESSA